MRVGGLVGRWVGGWVLCVVTGGWWCGRVVRGGLM